MFYNCSIELNVRVTLRSLAKPRMSGARVFCRVSLRGWIIRLSETYELGNNEEREGSTLGAAVRRHPVVLRKARMPMQDILALRGSP